MKKLLPHVLIAGIVGVVLFISYSAGLFYGSERFLEDRLAAPKPVDDRLIIVAIDDASLKRIGQWPWPRSVFAKAFAKLDQAKPLAVALDVVFAEPSRQGAADDRALSFALRDISYPLVLPVEGSLSYENGAYRAETLTGPLPQFLSNPKITQGHVNLILDPDGVVRRFPSSIASGDQEFKAMSVLLAERGGAAAGDGVRSIAYSSAPGGMRRIPFYRLLDEDMGKTLEGKLVLIGVTASDLHDEKRTPLSRGTLMSGVELQGNIANMLLKGYRAEPLASVPTFFLFMALALLAGLAVSLVESPARSLAAAVSIGVLFNIGAFLAFEGGVIVNLIHGNLAWLLSALLIFFHRYYSGTREKRELRKAFGKYVSPAVLESILENPDKIALGGEEREITVLFSDISGFTTLSERTTATELVRIMNRYFTLMTGEVLKYQGVLDKYIGDAVMAFWGAPLPDEKQADNAYLAAKGMLERLKEFNAELHKEKGITIDIGIGLYTGKAVVGNMGSEERFDYTAMGDTVNIASRLEGLNKEHKTHLIVGESTKAALTEPGAFRELGAVQVKGRNEPVRIFSLVE
ncbi:adenylate/guanylate cyclase domain-containing protein [Candidatus Parcubacteria bacterium]|nr:adenylate/guanylate cyclase domain-containing protein [Candidatus Parcubacteria bacterium]